MKWIAKWFLCFSVAFVILTGTEQAWGESLTSRLPLDRSLRFEGPPIGANYESDYWTHIGPAITGGFRAYLLAGTNHFHTSGWQVFSCRTGTGRLLGREIAPNVDTNHAAHLLNTLAAKIESPYYSEGIGTIYFDAINVTDPGKIVVEIATNMLDQTLWKTNDFLEPVETEDLKWLWQPIDELTLDAAYMTPSNLDPPSGTGHDFTRYIRCLNFRGPAKFRIRRTSLAETATENAYLAIDNIRVSKPPSDVVISRPEIVFLPGYPAAMTNITIHCVVNNVGTNEYSFTYSSKRSVYAWYRWRYLDQVTNNWSKIQMYLTDAGDDDGNGEMYAANLPVQPDVGDLEYYFECDFDGYRYKPDDLTGLGYIYYPSNSEGSESLSPRTLRGGATESDGREFYVRLRPFSSRYGSMYVVADQYEDPIEMSLVGDNKWRGMVPVKNGTITNLTWCFKGINAYVADSTLFDTNPVYWAEANQAKVNYVPFGGQCVQTDADARMQVLVDDCGYVEITFNTDTLEYMANSAEYQNFNQWTAPVDTFTESSGQATKQRFSNTFDAWPTNATDVKEEYFIGNPSQTNVFELDPFLTFNGWQAGSAAYVLDRGDADVLNRPDGPQYYRNRALRLKGGEAGLGLGYIHNLYSTRPDGLKAIEFKCHLGQPVDGDEITYYESGFSRSNYAVTMNVKALSMSPENPSLSVIGYYQGRDTFYEYRVTAIYNSSAPKTDKRLKHELYKWTNGSCYLLAAYSPSSDQILTTSTDLQIRFYNTGLLTRTDIRCSFTSSDMLSYTDSGQKGGSPIQSGTVGFLSAECQGLCSTVKLYDTNSSSPYSVISSTLETVLSSTSSTQLANDSKNWSLPAGRFIAQTSSTPYGLCSVIPTQSIGVYLQQSDRDSEEEPAAAGSASWMKYAEIPVTGFDYQTYSQSLKLWRSQYLMLRVMGRSDALNVDVTVDGLLISSWRGQESSDSGNAENEDWVASEAWVVTNSAALGNVVELDLTRADPNEDQAIRSLELTNGMGMLEFDYKVLQAPAKLTVQYDAGDDDLGWVDVKSFVVSNAMSSFTHALAYLGTNEWGFLRVLNDRSSGYSNAVVQINNIVAWDEPYVSDTSWRVYNAKVTDTDKQRVMLDESKACFLNNSQTADADPAETLYLPFVQTPVLPNGLGKLTFMARAYSNNQPATVTVFVSTNGWNAPDDDWFSVKTYSISNMLYETQTYEPDAKVGGTYDAVRLVTWTTPGSYRACLEEIAVSEPVFPGFDIENVKVLCQDSNGDYSSTRFQPLDSDLVGVEAVMSNVRLSPSNIHMYVSYYVGTNVWGISNWPESDVKTKEMVRVSPTSMVFRTLPSDDLPFQEKDQIVQYHVWARFMGGIQLETQQTTFDIPDWYYPVDLNETYATSGWSPYYLVYGVPLGSVWINEINAYDRPEDDGTRRAGENKFIEIAVPSGVDLGGWSIDLVKDDESVTTITIPTGLDLPQSVTNNYSFFVIAQAQDFMDDPPPALSNVNYETSLLDSDHMPYLSPGGIRLRRPMGMYEHSVAYDMEPEWLSGALWVTNHPDLRFVYVGKEDVGGSLCVTNSRSCELPTAQDWTFPLTWTPGAPNVGQNVPDFSLAAPGISNAVITSVMDVSYGTQGDLRVSPLSMKVLKTSTTNIEYQADNWYRLRSITVNGSEVLNNGDVTRYNLVLANIETNLTILVTVGLRQDVQSLELGGNVLNWLLGFGDAPLAPTYYYGRELSLTEMYWLNANPTTTNYLEGSIVKLEKEDATTNYFMTAKLALNGTNCTQLMGDSGYGDAVFKIKVSQDLTDPDWTMIGQYALSANSFDTNHLSRIFIANPFRYWLPDSDSQDLFFRWVIEYEDPRFSKPTLVNSNAPAVSPP